MPMAGESSNARDHEPAAKRRKTIMDFFRPVPSGSGQRDVQADNHASAAEVDNRGSSSVNAGNEGPVSPPSNALDVAATGSASNESVDTEPLEGPSEPNLSDGRADKGLCAFGRCDVAHPNDIGRLVSKRKSLTDQELFRGLKERWVPSNRNEFPTCYHDNAGKPRPRRCTEKILRDFPWLAVSQYGEQTGAWCVSCLLFGVSDKGGGQKLGKLVKQPLRCFKRLTFCADKNSKQRKDGQLTEHNSHPYHVTNHIRATEFLLRMEAPQEQVSEQMKALMESQDRRTVAALRSIVETVCLAATQNISLRGHRDDGRVDPGASVLSETNDGNLRTLLRMRAQAGDETLAEHLKKAPGNAMYVSKTAQNEILQVCSSIIKEGVVQRCKDAPFWCIGADDTTDRSSSEQMAITVRYVAKGKGDSGANAIDKLIVREDPVAVVNVMEEIGSDADDTEKRMSGKNLGDVILSKVSELGLQPEMMVAQAYDGAACMSSQRVGVVAQVKEVAPQAEYFHCSSHGLNLATSKVMKVQGMKNTIGTVESVVAFLTDGAKRCDALKRVQERLGVKKHHLLKMCPTRFVERHTATERFVEQLPVVVETLRDIESWHDPATSTRAGLLLTGLLKSEVMVGLFILLKISCLLLPPSRALQERGADLVAATQLLDGVLEELGRLREDSDHFSRIFQEAESAMVAAVGSKITKPRVAKGKSVHRAAAGASTSEAGEPDSAEDYFRRNLFAPALDHLLVDLKARFGEQQRQSATLTNLVSARVPDTSWADVQPAWQKYGHLIPITERQAESELIVWRGMCTRMPPEKRPRTAIESLRRCPGDTFPAMSRLLMILATLPVSTAEAERVFSKLDRTLTAIRSTMTESRLEALVLMQAYRGELPGAAEVVDRFLKLPGKRSA